MPGFDGGGFAGSGEAPVDVTLTVDGVVYTISADPTMASLKAIREVAEVVLPPGYGYDWAGEAREEVSSGATSAYAFAFGLIFVFLILAAAGSAFGYLQSLD